MDLKTLFQSSMGSMSGSSLRDQEQVLGLRIETGHLRSIQQLRREGIRAWVSGLFKQSVTEDCLLGEMLPCLMKSSQLMKEIRHEGLERV